MIEIVLIAAVAENGVIGRDGVTPWRLKSDMRRFRALTVGRPGVMGRRTWLALPVRPLPRRTNIVVTRDAAFAAPGALVAPSLQAALAMHRRWRWRSVSRSRMSTPRRRAMRASLRSIRRSGAKASAKATRPGRKTTPHTIS